MPKKKLSVDGIRSDIEVVKGAEKLTKKTLGSLSRDLLRFVFIDGNDRVELVNECIRVLTPMNKKTAILFFKHHLPWAFDDSVNKFTTKFDEGKKMQRKLETTRELLADVNQNIWTWAEREIKIDTVPDYAGRVSSAIKQALKGKGDDGAGKLTPAQVMQSVLAGGITAENLMSMIDDITTANREAMAEVEGNEAQAIAEAA